MTAVLPARTPSVPRATSGQVVRAIARPEALRLLRHPLLWVGVALSSAAAYASFHAPDEWSGARYQSGPIVFGPLLVAISMVVAGTFHRERAGLAPEAPVGEASRSGGRLLGAGALVLLVLVLTAAGGLTARLTGGDALGDEPGRTLHAHYTLGELLQPVALAVLAVAVGAAAGRRFRHRATAYLVLFVAWFPFVMVGWAFQGRRVTPFSVIQIQPVYVPVGPVQSNPNDYPSEWLLASPNEYQAHWDRLFVSSHLAGWHDVWLLGLACLFLALVLPRGRRRWLAGAGLVLAVAGVAAQYLVIP
jgi:hypothetical protein